MDIIAKLKDYKRVLMIARKPTKEEFQSTTKVCVLGIFLIGVIGFLIFLSFVFAGLY